MNVKILLLAFAMLLLSGCQGSAAGCGGCVSGYWSTSCNVPNSGGASESQFTQYGNPWEVAGDYTYSGWDGNSGDCPNCGGASYTSYSSCGAGGCGAYSAGPNW